jgi:hypothetical protein
MAFPLILEFLIALPLLSLHLIGGGTFWGLGALITVSGAAALVLGVVVSFVIFFQNKKYFSTGTKPLAYTALALTVLYIVLVCFMIFDFSKMY